MFGGCLVQADMKRHYRAEKANTTRCHWVDGSDPAFKKSRLESVWNTLHCGECVKKQKDASGLSAGVSRSQLEKLTMIKKDACGLSAGVSRWLLIRHALAASFSSVREPPEGKPLASKKLSPRLL